jgi:hypothetical protein
MEQSRVTCGYELRFRPHAHDNRDDEQLHEPIAGVNGGQPPRDVIPEDRTREQNHGKPDPQRKAEVHRDQPTADAEQGDETRDDAREEMQRANSMTSFATGIFAPAIAATGSKPRSRIHDL